MTVLEQKIKALAAFRSILDAKPTPADSDARAAHLSLQNLIGVSHSDAIRRFTKQTGSLEHLSRMKSAMRDGAEVLSFAYMQNADALSGFVYGDEPQNFEQWSVGLFNELLLALTASIAEIEAECSDTQRAQFDAERTRQYKQDQHRRSTQAL